MYILYGFSEATFGAIGKRKKLGRPPNDRFSATMKRSHSENISLTQKLEVAIDNGLYLLDKCAELRNTCNKLTNKNTQLRNRLEQSIISSKKLSKEVRQLLTDAKNVLNLEQQSFELQTVKTECDVYKQHVSDMAEQSLITKYQTSILFPEKQNKEMLEGGISELSFLYPASVK
ncbi:14660_t:CDS:2, partial [Rhizophagus irregularis]